MSPNSIATFFILLSLYCAFTKAQNYTDAEKEQMWKQNLNCTKEKDETRINLLTISGTYVIPYVYAPGYWGSFGRTLCKWIYIVPESKDKVRYSGGYFNSSTGNKVYSYTGQMKYNDKDRVYNTEENFVTINKTFVFSTVPCVATLDTFMFYVPVVRANKTCTSQSFVFSRNFKTANRDRNILQRRCIAKFGIPRNEFPALTNGCRDVGLFR